LSEIGCASQQVSHSVAWSVEFKLSTGGTRSITRQSAGGHMLSSQTHAGHATNLGNRWREREVLRRTHVRARWQHVYTWASRVQDASDRVPELVLSRVPGWLARLTQIRLFCLCMCVCVQHAWCDTTTRIARIAFNGWLPLTLQNLNSHTHTHRSARAN